MIHPRPFRCQTAQRVWWEGAIQYVLAQGKSEPGACRGTNWDRRYMDSARTRSAQSWWTADGVFECIAKLDRAVGLLALAIIAEMSRDNGLTGQGDIQPLLQSVRITAERLYRYRAIRQEFQATEVLAAAMQPYIDALQDIRFGAVAGSGRGGSVARSSTRHSCGDRLLNIVQINEWSDPQCSSAISWLARGGQWAYWTMDLTSQTLLCRIAAASLCHGDPAAVLLTMKLGRTFGFGVAYRNGESLELSVAEALAAVGELPDRSPRAGETISVVSIRFRQALKALLDAGVIKDVTWHDARAALFDDGNHVPLHPRLESRFRFSAVGQPGRTSSCGWHG